MASRRNPKRRGAAAAKDEERLRGMIAEATVDAHDESEAVMGFWDALQDELALPFKTEVLGVEVVVQDIGMTDDDQIVAVCKRGKTRQRIRLDELPLPDPPPTGAQWIEAYRRWRELG